MAQNFSYQHILKNSDAIIACTNLEKEYYQKFGINKQQIHVIPPAIDPNEYKKPNIEKFKETYNIPEDAPLLLFMGRKGFGKGVLQSIFALKYLIKKFKNIKLMIAGTSTREYRILLNNLPQSLKNHIIDMGIVDIDTKSNALASCDVFLLPSLDDASLNMSYLSILITFHTLSKDSSSICFLFLK